MYPDDAEEEKPEEAQNKPPVSQANADGSIASFEGYTDYDELAEVTEMLNVDAFDNVAGGIMPGQQLSSLCSDD